MIECFYEHFRGEKMSKEKVRCINDEWADDIKRDGSYYEFYMYEPFSDAYWAEKRKIVFCNTNPYGYNVPQDPIAKKEFDQTPVLIWEIFEKWLNENARNTTIPRSALFMYCLYKTLQGHTFTEENLESSFFSNTHEADMVLKKMAYMNLQNEIGKSEIDESEEAEINRWFSECNGVNAKSFRELVSALDPDIFIITGKFGLKVLNEKIYIGGLNLKNQGVVKLGKTLFVHLYHPSPKSKEFTNEYILKRVNELVRQVNE
jgi:hypothetical protein